ncbi:hypothetical protein [Haladaptatus sp. NG-WS-4]
MPIDVTEAEWEDAKRKQSAAEIILEFLRENSGMAYTAEEILHEFDDRDVEEIETLEEMSKRMETDPDWNTGDNFIIVARHLHQSEIQQYLEKLVDQEKVENRVVDVEKPPYYTISE